MSARDTTTTTTTTTTTLLLLLLLLHCYYYTTTTALLLLHYYYYYYYYYYHYYYYTSTTTLLLLHYYYYYHYCPRRGVKTGSATAQSTPGACGCAVAQDGHRGPPPNLVSNPHKLPRGANPPDTARLRHTQMAARPHSQTAGTLVPPTT